MKRPVFVVGCPRSGTTLLYSMLVAAGGFAFYRKETYFYDLAPRFPRLASARARQDFLDRFLAGYLGRVPGLDVVPIARRAIDQSRTTVEFLPRLMFTTTSAGLSLQILPSLAIGVPLGAFIFRHVQTETFRRLCMSFDAWIVGFGLASLLRVLRLTGDGAALMVFITVAAIDSWLLYRFFRGGRRTYHTSTEALEAR